MENVLEIADECVGDDVIAYWLENTKQELTNNINIILQTTTAERETLEIMKNLIQTIKVIPQEKY